MGRTTIPQRPNSPLEVRMTISQFTRGMSDIRSRWLAQMMIALALMGLVSSVSTISTAGGIEFRETDTLPYVENILFSPSSVGIVSQDGRLFRVDRQSHDVQQLDAQTFAQQFPTPWPPKPSDPSRSAPN